MLIQWFMPMQWHNRTAAAGNATHHDTMLHGRCWVKQTRWSYARHAGGPMQENRIGALNLEWHDIQMRDLRFCWPVRVMNSYICCHHTVSLNTSHCSTLFREQSCSMVWRYFFVQWMSIRENFIFWTPFDFHCLDKSSWNILQNIFCVPQKKSKNPQRSLTICDEFTLGREHLKHKATQYDCDLKKCCTFNPISCDYISKCRFYMKSYNMKRMIKVFMKVPPKHNHH